MKRVYYAILIVVIIGSGLLSRRVSVVPLFIGDMLYAMMMVALFRFVFLFRSLHIVCLFALLSCFAIEFSQLLTYDWLVQSRATLLGKLILGQGFLWSDIFAYTVGVLSLGLFLSHVERSVSKLTQ